MIVWVYLVGAVLAVWPITQLIAKADPAPSASSDDSFDRFFAVMFGLIGAALWPVILGGWLAWTLSKAVWTRILPDREDSKVE